MVTYTSYCDIDSGSVLDEILHHGDILYQNTINVLKREGKFINALLSLDEIPEVFEVENVQYQVEKQPIVGGVLVKINKYEVVSGTTTSIVDNLVLPTLHEALQLALSQSSSVLITTGAICSAVHITDDLYMFFDSHSRG